MSRTKKEKRDKITSIRPKKAKKRKSNQLANNISQKREAKVTGFFKKNNGKYLGRD